MLEETLHYIWKNIRYPLHLDLATTTGDRVTVICPGYQNHHAGPDILEAQLIIDQEFWVGTIEIHRNASDWYRHGHDDDHRYQNVILHLVWNDDLAQEKARRINIPTVQLKDFISEQQLEKFSTRYKNGKDQFIICQNDMTSISKPIWDTWLQKLYLERLEGKCKEINALLLETKYNWEEVLFILLLRNFGLHQNKEIFFHLSRAIKYSIILKLKSNITHLESVLFGSAGLLEKSVSEDSYWTTLQKNFLYLKNKFSLPDRLVQKPFFFRLRPSGFPTIRLSQFARIYHRESHLFSRLMTFDEVAKFYDLLRVAPSAYWKTHYVFGKPSNKLRQHKLSKSFIDALLVNAIIPLKFCYHKWKAKPRQNEITSMLGELSPENNKIIRGFGKYKIRCSNALHSQALLQLFSNYCSKQRCLECAIGINLLKVK